MSVFQRRTAGQTEQNRVFTLCIGVVYLIILDFCGSRQVGIDKKLVPNVCLSSYFT